MSRRVLVLVGLLVCAVFAHPRAAYTVDDDNNDNDDEDQDVRAFEGDDDNTVAELSTPSSSTKVFERIESLEEAIVSSKLNTADRSAALENLNHIRNDAHLMESASTSHKQQLREAMRLRTEALKLQLSSHHPSAVEDNNDDDDDVPASSHNVLEEDDDNDDDDDDNNVQQELKQDDDDDDDMVSKITQDISRVESSIDASTLGDKLAAKVTNNLDAIRADAARYGHSDHQTREKLSEAMKLRVSALKLMLNSKPSTAHSHNDFIAKEAERVQSEISRVETEIDKSFASARDKNDARLNLQAIRRDAEELASHPPLLRARHLKRAMKLRMQALHEQLQ